MTQDVLDKFLKEVSYKFPKGYPDMKDPQDVKLLNKLVMEYTKSKAVIKESQEYDNLITRVLGPDVTPTQQYKLGDATTLQGQDKENFQKLYSVAPGKKADQDGAASKGSGHGEVALYWLLKNSYDSVEDSRGGSKPDLTVDGVGVEVKAYDVDKMGLGRIGSDKATIAILDVIFGISALAHSLDDGEKREGSSLNFKKNDVIAAFKTAKEFASNTAIRELNIPIIQQIITKVEQAFATLGIGADASSEQAAAKAIKVYLKNKLAKKPGFGGYIANVNPSGQITYIQIPDGAGVDSLDDTKILNNTEVYQGTIVFKPAEIF
jgi:hypothetical protein